MPKPDRTLTAPPGPTAGRSQPALEEGGRDDV